jgi:hypothetical protein
MQETLGNIKVVRMIWVQTLGVVGSLLFCVNQALLSISTQVHIKSYLLL